MQKNEFRAICKSRLKSHAARAARCEHYLLLRRIEGLAKFLKARKIGTLKSFTLSCNARIQLKEKSL